MIRRKLTAFTMMYIAGIAAGFFLFEGMKLAETFGFLASVCISAVFLIDGRRSRISRESIFLVLFLAAGFLSFSLRFALYESQLSDFDSCDDGEAVQLRGTVIEAEEKDDKLKIILKTEEYGAVQLITSGCDDMDVWELSGASIEADAKYRELLPADDPGCFDNRLYMRGKGICLSFRSDGFDFTDPDITLHGRLRRRLCRVREEFAACFDEETSAFIRGVIFGDKSRLDEEITEEFNENSTGHILAVSGLHVGFLYALLRALTGRRRTAGISAAVIAVLLMYGEMTMWSAATLRACIVMSISLLSVHIRRPFDLLTSVSAAALAILCYQPYQLFDAGFQMSFLAMSGIAFFTKPLSIAAGESLGPMLAVQLGTMPVTAYRFCRINPLAIFINIPVILLSSLLVPLCIVMLAIMLVSGHVPECGKEAAELISFAVIKINHLLNFDGSFSYKAAGVSSAGAAAFYVFSFAAASEWTRIRLIRKEKKKLLRAALLISLPLIMLTACLHEPILDDEIVFVAVGQGDCTHIRVNGSGISRFSGSGKDVLIDGGGREDFDTGKRILMPYLLHSGAEAVDMALVTHLHMDHYKGIFELCREYPVGAVGIPADYKNADLNSMYDEQYQVIKNEMIRYIRPESKIVLSDNIYIDTIWPVEISDVSISADDPNEHNTVYMIHYQGIKVMVTGDLTEDDEMKMLDHYRKAGREDILKCDVLKVAHHGSKSSSSEAFLDAADPGIAVIQAGRNNIYGHPHQQTLDRLESRGIEIFRTDINGAVGIDIKNGKVSAEPFRNDSL